MSFFAWTVLPRWTHVLNFEIEVLLATAQEQCFLM